MTYDHYNKQLKTLLLALGILGIFILTVLTIFWGNFCSQDFATCLKTESLSPGTFFILSFLRPFFFTPISLFAILAGNSFGVYLGTLYTALGGLASCVCLFLAAKLLGKRYVRPWFYANLPQTYRFIKSQDWKLILVLRFIPVLPYDGLTLLFGLLDFRWKKILAFTFVASLPELFIFSRISDPSETWASSTIRTSFWVCFFSLLPGMVIEFRSRKEGSSMWGRLKAAWQEIIFEIRLHNLVIRDRSHDPTKTPVVLLYGFFSSRRTLTYLELFLEGKGYEVINFNLGGLCGVFSTHSIITSSDIVDKKLKRLCELYGIKKLNIVAHSKGGLIAFWWLIRHRGHKHCDKLITLGTPFNGSYFTWLAILTPFSMLLKDVWDMRPGSLFLEQLKAIHLPSSLSIFNLYSKSDHVSRGEKGVYQPMHHREQVKTIEIPQIGHEDFLRKKVVGEKLVNILGSPFKERATHSTDGAA
jgi:uncharacterized membrane protein YdjX (TVP38/TMEM64 family)/pimeloyl-ACP methyl ester carboxylesterase